MFEARSTDVALQMNSPASPTGKVDWFEESKNPLRMFSCWSFGQLRKARKMWDSYNHSRQCVFAIGVRGWPRWWCGAFQNIGCAAMLMQIKSSYIGDFEPQSAAASWHRRHECIASLGPVSFKFVLRPQLFFVFLFFCPNSCLFITRDCTLRVCLLRK